MRRPEQALHLAVAAYLRVALRPPTYWTTIDHGAGKMTKAAAGLRKQRGVQAGIADLLVVHPMGLTYSDGALVVWIELKAGRGDQSIPQVAFEKQMWACGCQYYVARSVDEVEAVLRQMGIPLHATVTGRGNVWRTAA